MKSKAVAALLAIFLGELGIPRFYLGDNATGVAYLFASCVGMLTLGTGVGGGIIINNQLLKGFSNLKTFTKI